MKRKPPPPRPDGKPRRKWKPKKAGAAALAADMVKKRGAIRLRNFGGEFPAESLLD